MRKKERERDMTVYYINMMLLRDKKSVCTAWTKKTIFYRIADSAIMEQYTVYTVVYVFLDRFSPFNGK